MGKTAQDERVALYTFDFQQEEKRRTSKKKGGKKENKIKLN